nr:hypothetical protein [Legionella tunisiensis]
MAAGYDYLVLKDSETDPLHHNSFAWQMHLSSYWYWRYLIEGQQQEIKIIPLTNTSFKVKINEEEFTLSPRLIADKLYLDDGQQIREILVDNQGSKLTLYLAQGPLVIERFNWQNFDPQLATKKGNSPLLCQRLSWLF